MRATNPTSQVHALLGYAIDHMFTEMLLYTVSTVSYFDFISAWFLTLG